MRQSNPPQNNAYAQAAGAYGSNAQQHADNQREIEARALLKSAKFIEDIQKGEWDEETRSSLEETLKYNRKLWLMFYDTALENPDEDRPNDLRSNIINLANFIFKREVEVLSEPEEQKQRDKLSILVEINREIAAGLMSTPAEDADTQLQDSTPEIEGDALQTAPSPETEKTAKTA